MTSSEPGQVAADLGDILVGQVDGHRLVLEKLGNVEDETENKEAADHNAGSLDGAVRLGCEGVANHDVAIHSEGQGQPDGYHLEQNNMNNRVSVLLF